MSVHPRGSGAAVSGLLVLGALLALLVAAWGVAFGAGTTELDRADARLASEVRAASAGFSGLVAAADARAGSLAASPALQRAVLSRNRGAIRDALHGRPDIAVYGGSELLVGSIPPGAVTRTVRVVAKSKSVGRVVAVIPVDDPLLNRLANSAGVSPPDRLWVRVGSDAQNVRLGKAVDLVQGRKYRVFAAKLVDAPPVVLEAATPRAEIGQGTRTRTFWLILATLVSLATLAVAARGLYLVSGRRRTRPRRRDVRQVVALLGDALAYTHEPDRLLPVILHAAMEATGAVAGVAIRGGEEVAREGSFERTGAPLRLELASPEVAGEELALILHPLPTGFDERTIALAHSLVAQAAVALDNARLHGIVKRQAVTDELTGLANRRSFRESLDTELLRAERFGNGLALIVADLDDFKDVNDLFGHQVGDEVLRVFSEVLQGRIRGIDLAARLGGEEFAILLPETDALGAEALAENLRLAVAELAVPAGEAQVHITASFGVAAFPESHNADELMTAADLALYGAKRQGKDRVVTVNPEMP
ncbi:MAG: GGDEF domain-containing protein [Actinobacteria bacterium]|nr:MAG: GGDEF domain-containing protein [Actinomycetota bacterium]